MLTDSELVAEIRAGLEAVTPPAPWLPETVEKRLLERPPRRTYRIPHGFRLGLDFLAVTLLIALAVGAVGVFLALHRPYVPVRPGSGPVIFPTVMTSATSGWALVGTSELWRTTDGGASWTKVSPPYLPDRVIDADLNSFVDGEHAVITELGGGRSGGLAFYWVSFRTVDGGHTWQQGNSLIDPFHPSDARQYFLDANTGWLVLSDTSTHAAWPSLYGTDDGGLHWSLVASNVGAITAMGSATPCFAQVAFSSAATGWLLVSVCEQSAPGTPSVSHDILLLTHDGGVTWQVPALPMTPASGSRFDVPVFFDQLHGLIVVHSPEPTLLSTSDGGSTWSVRSLPGESQREVDFVDPDHGWAIAGPSSMFTKTKDNSQTIVSLPLYHTDNGGSTWTPVRTNIRLESPVGVAFSQPYFVDRKTGFLTLFTLSLGPSEFLKTTDGGRTWNVVRACRAGLGWTNPSPACPSSSPHA